jgi:hypothetical protein
VTETDQKPKLSEVVPIRDPGGTHDFMFRGKQVKLVLDPCSCGIEAKWIYEIPVRDTLPSFLKDMGLQVPDEMIQKTIMEWHWHPKWWQRLLPMSMEWWLRRWLKTTRAEFKKQDEKHTKLDLLREKVNREDFLL